MRLLAINPRKRADLYAENHKTRVKEVPEDVKTWRDLPCLSAEMLVGRCEFFPAGSIDPVCTPSQHPTSFVIHFNELILKLLWKAKAFE